MMKSPLMRFVGMGVWLVTALASLNMGLAMMMQFDFFKMDFMMTSPGLMNALYYLIGISGLISLIFFIMACMHGKCHCASCGCGVSH